MKKYIKPSVDVFEVASIFTDKIIGESVPPQVSDEPVEGEENYT